MVERGRYFTVKVVDDSARGLTSLLEFRFFFRVCQEGRTYKPCFLNGLGRRHGVRCCIPLVGTGHFSIRSKLSGTTLSCSPCFHFWRGCFRLNCRCS